jgi:glucosamine-6-phosphate deaminase
MTEIRVVSGGDFGAACLQALLEAVGDEAAPVVGLPTGNSPIPLYEELRAAVESGRLDLSRWRPIAIDEYGGPRDHPCSNRAFFARYWDTIPGAAAVEQFDPGGPDSNTECVRMRAAVGAAGGLTVALLGVGLNGHLAFNEPGSARDSSVRRVDLHEGSRTSAQACWGNDPPRWGLTLGLRELLGASKVIVIANGARKAEVMRLVLQGPISTDYPGSLAREHPRAVFVLDEAAAPKP